MGDDMNRLRELRKARGYTQIKMRCIMADYFTPFSLRVLEELPAKVRGSAGDIS